MSSLYVGNIPFSCDEVMLEEIFSVHGDVQSVRAVTDESGRPRGYAFIEYVDPSAAQKAIEALDGSELGGRTIRVSPAQPRRRERET